MRSLFSIVSRGSTDLQDLHLLSQLQIVEVTVHRSVELHDPVIPLRGQFRRSLKGECHFHVSGVRRAEGSEGSCIWGQTSRKGKGCIWGHKGCIWGQTSRKDLGMSPERQQRPPFAHPRKDLPEILDAMYTCIPFITKLSIEAVRASATAWSLKVEATSTSLVGGLDCRYRNLVTLVGALVGGLHCRYRYLRGGIIVDRWPEAQALTCTQPRLFEAEIAT